MIEVRRLQRSELDLARQLFMLMRDVFLEEPPQLSETYLQSLLSRDDFWAIAAFADNKIIGGATAHALPMTRTESTEMFIYDIAVAVDHQRKGVGRLLVTMLREAAAKVGIHDVFVAADNDDVHALDFYRALGGESSPVTVFDFAG